MFDNFEKYSNILNYLTFTLSAVFYVSYIVTFLYRHFNRRDKYNDHFSEVLVDIVEAYSRNTTDETPNIDDDDIDIGHWIFWSGKEIDPQFQATNCEVCGKYIISHTKNAPKCKCKNDINNTHFINDSAGTYNWISDNTDDYLHKYSL